MAPYTVGEYCFESGHSIYSHLLVEFHWVRPNFMNESTSSHFFETRTLLEIFPSPTSGCLILIAASRYDIIMRLLRWLNIFNQCYLDTAGPCSSRRLPADCRPIAGRFLQKIRNRDDNRIFEIRTLLKKPCSTRW